MFPSIVFETRYATILQQLEQVNPVEYAASRNHVKGAVSYLSPYISRGVLSTRQVYESLLSRGFTTPQFEKFVQELAWRDYWQQQWRIHQSKINSDLKNKQPLAARVGFPINLLNHQTGIDAIDTGIELFYLNGYLHNHVRMYIASLTCNIARCGWNTGARWMYYHLLDADWASNALSWQWVCGANSSKLYYANQQNINTYCGTQQHHTFLDTSYEQLPELPIPEVMQKIVIPTLTTELPHTAPPTLNPTADTLVYNFYNLDPLWHQHKSANRILLLEPSVFEQYPVSANSIQFCINLAVQNIPGIQVWVAEFSELKQRVQGTIYFKEHPLNKYEGTMDERSWLTGVKGNYHSFFAFWKQCQKELF